MVHKMVLSEAVGKNLLDRVLTKVTGKPQRWIYFPPGRACEFFGGFFFFLFFFNPRFLQRMPSSSSHSTYPHTLWHMYSHSYVHSDMPSCPSLPAPLPLMAVPRTAWVPQKGLIFPGAAAAAGPSIGQCSLPLGAELQPLSTGKGLGGQNWGDGDMEHTAPLPDGLSCSGSLGYQASAPLTTLPFASPLT